MSGMVKYLYLRDLKNSKRVITVARQLTDDDRMRIGVAVCKPNLKPTAFTWGTVGDEFTKKRGREIALGRMNKSKEFISLDGQQPIKVAINTLLSLKGSVGRITQQHVIQRQLKKEQG